MLQKIKFFGTACFFRKELKNSSPGKDIDFMVHNYIPKMKTVQPKSHVTLLCNSGRKTRAHTVVYTLDQCGLHVF